MESAPGMRSPLQERPDDGIVRVLAWNAGVMSWPRAQLRKFQNSYETAHAVAGSHPLGTALAAGSLCVALAIVGYVPNLAARSGFDRPWVALALVVAAATATHVAWRHGCRGTTGSLATLLDNGLYSAALTYAATNTEGAYATGFAITHGLMVLAFPAQTYGLTLAFASVLALPLVLALVLASPTITVTIILVASYGMALVLSHMTGTRRRLLRAQAKLAQAVGATSQLADESIQAALGTTLLSLGNFLHELKNHQTTVHANLAFIDTCGQLDGEYRAALADAARAQEAEQRLVIETIESLKQRAEPASTNTAFLLNDLLAQTVAEIQGIQVELTCCDHRFLLKGAPDHLSAVVHNLVRNSEQAGAQRVCIDVRVEPSGQAARLTIHDDGPGIPDSTRNSLFTPFGGTTKADGTGLGLYLCRRYVELFGGSIEVEVGPLGGAAFLIRLPGRVFTTSAAYPTVLDAAVRSA